MMTPRRAGRLARRTKLQLAQRAADLLGHLLRWGGPASYHWMVRALWDRRPLDPNYEIRIVADPPRDPDPTDLPMVERIFAAYLRAKRDQANHGPFFHPQGGWKNVVDTAFAPLIESLADKDIRRFHFFLANFGAWDKTLGFGPFHIMRRIAGSARESRRFIQSPFAAASLDEFDLLLLPSFDIERLAPGAIDLFLNENSLGMMTPDTCRHYVESICRVSHAFWHRNHEVRRNRFEDGSCSLVNGEYPIPAEQWRCVARSPDVAQLAQPTEARVGSDMYWYFYRQSDER